MGRPKKLTPRQVKLGVNRYFKSITITKPMTTLRATGEKDNKGKDIMEEAPLLNDLGEQLEEVIYMKNPSMGRLAMFMGVHRETLINYAKDPEYIDSLKRAKQIIENYLEDKLYGNNVTGVIFNLKNNFGWKDKSEVEVSANNRLEDFFGDD